jgi:hypothetical protein
MSRLGFLKEQQIPTSLRPPSFRQPISAVLVDDQLLYINGEMDFKSTRKYTLTTPSDEEKAKFEQAFNEAMSAPIKAVAHPVPMVGKSSANPNYQPKFKQQAPQPVSTPEPVRRGKVETDGSYRYHYSDRSAPPGVPKRLPKETLWQKKQSELNNNNQLPQPAPPKDAGTSGAPQ